MNTAIIVAAGSGERFGSDTPKQFYSILGKPILVHTLERFENCDSIDQIVLVLHESEIESFSQTLSEFRIKKLKAVVAGGAARTESVRNGFAAIDSDSAGVIAVHDGARPLISKQEISATVAKASETGAACLVAEVTDTIKEVAGESIIKTIDRRKLRRALTPQCFRYDLLAKALDQAAGEKSATDECFLVEKLGHEVAIVKGNARNIKITHAEDILLAESLLREFAAAN